MSLSFASSLASCSRRTPSLFTPTFATPLARSFSSSQSLLYPPKKKKTTQRKASDVTVPEALSLREAHRLLRAWEFGRTGSSITLDLVVEPDKKKPSMRGRTHFPRSTSRVEESILLICAENEQEEGLDAGATIVGGAEIFPDLLSGKIPLPDTVLCTLSMIDETQRQLAKFLGPKNLMPNVKRGTVFNNVTDGVQANRGAVEWKVSKEGTLGLTIAHPTWPYEDVEDNVLTLLEEVRTCGGGGVLEMSNKANNVLAMRLSSTRGPGVLINDILSRPRPA